MASDRDRPSRAYRVDTGRDLAVRAKELSRRLSEFDESIHVAGVHALLNATVQLRWCRGAEVGMVARCGVRLLCHARIVAPGQRTKICQMADAARGIGGS